MQVQRHGWPRLRPVRVGRLPPQLKFCASELSDAVAARLSASGRQGRLRTFSFGSASAKATFYGGRASFSRSKISRRLRRVAPAADIRLRKSRSASAAQTAAPAQFSSLPSWRDETLLKKQDGIASFITHCKEVHPPWTCRSSGTGLMIGHGKSDWMKCALRGFNNTTEHTSSHGSFRVSPVARRKPSQWQISRQGVAGCAKKSKKRSRLPLLNPGLFCAVPRGTD